jgi:hypothetical protein
MPWCSSTLLNTVTFRHPDDSQSLASSEARGLFAGSLLLRVPQVGGGSVWSSSGNRAGCLFLSEGARSGGEAVRRTAGWPRGGLASYRGGESAVLLTESGGWIRSERAPTGRRKYGHQPCRTIDEIDFQNLAEEFPIRGEAAMPEAVAENNLIPLPLWVVRTERFAHQRYAENLEELGRDAEPTQAFAAIGQSVGV